MSCRATARHLIRLARGLLVTVAIAACGDGADARRSSEGGAAPASAQVAGGPDACSLIPKAELEQVLGSPLGPPEPGQSITSGETTMTSCGWRTVDGQAGASFGLRRGPDYRPDPKVFERYASGYEENIGTRPEVQAVPGLGSAALWDATNHVLLVRPAQPGSELNVQPYVSTRVPMIDLAQARGVAEAALLHLAEAGNR